MDPFHECYARDRLANVRLPLRNEAIGPLVWLDNAGNVSMIENELDWRYTVRVSDDRGRFIRIAAPGSVAVVIKNLHRVIR